MLLPYQKKGPVLRTAIAAPVWRGRNSGFDMPYGSKNGLKISAELY
jgi:hypothetical protein